MDTSVTDQPGPFRRREVGASHRPLVCRRPTKERVPVRSRRHLALAAGRTPICLIRLRSSFKPGPKSEVTRAYLRGGLHVEPDLTPFRRTDLPVRVPPTPKLPGTNHSGSGDRSQPVPGPRPPRVGNIGEITLVVKRWLKIFSVRGSSTRELGVLPHG